MAVWPTDVYSSGAAGNRAYNYFASIHSDPKSSALRSFEGVSLYRVDRPLQLLDHLKANNRARAEPMVAADGEFFNRLER